MSVCGKRPSSTVFPHRSSVAFQQWPAAGSDSETEIGFTTKTGAMHRNEAENRRAQKIDRYAASQLEPSAEMELCFRMCLERAMGIEQIRMNQTKALPPVPQFNWSQMESSYAKSYDSPVAAVKIGKLRWCGSMWRVRRKFHPKIHVPKTGTGAPGLDSLNISRVQPHGID